MVLIAFFTNSFDYLLVRYVGTGAIMLFSFCLIMSIRKEGFAAALCVILGCITILFGMLVANDITSTKPFFRFQFLYDTADYVRGIQISKEYLHLYSIVTGASVIALGLVFAYRPSLIQVKNYLPFEYPYPIWKSKRQPITKFSKNLIPIKELLTEQEKLRCCRFSYLLVSIDDKLYLTPPNEEIPEDAQIMRTKSGNTLCGISRIH